jgi:uncharacterized paraquat-inducible protein A
MDISVPSEIYLRAVKMTLLVIKVKCYVKLANNWRNAEWSLLPTLCTAHFVEIQRKEKTRF